MGKTYILIVAEETINVFEGSICGFGKEEVNNGNERSVKNGPYYIEPPLCLDENYP